MDFSAADYLDLEHTMHGSLFRDGEPLWTALGRIKGYLTERISHFDGPRIRGTVSELAAVGDQVFIGAGTVVEPYATIKGPAWIGENCTVRSGAYVRENVITGDSVMLGNASEFKNCLLFDHVEAPHYNYIGDSILGYRAHLGAGAVCSNVRLDRQNVRVGASKLDSGLRKFGAIVGDRTEVGCNSVLNPGSVLGRDGIVYPGTSWHGVLGDRQVVKNRQTQEVVNRELPQGES